MSEEESNTTIVTEGQHGDSERKISGKAWGSVKVSCNEFLTECSIKCSALYSFKSVVSHCKNFQIKSLDFEYSYNTNL